jgi:hypothetical protein
MSFQQFGSLSGLVKAYESSGGNYTAQNPRTTASGAYQFTDPTWQRFASGAGVDIAQYPTAASAPPVVQDQVFSHTVSQVGLQPWTCTGCNANISNYVAANDVSSLPVFEGGLPAGASGSPIMLASAQGPAPGAAPGGIEYDPSIDPLGAGVGGSGSLLDIPAGLATQGATTIVGLGSGLQQTVTGWLGSVETSVGNAVTGVFKTLFEGAQNWLVRGLLIFVGIVLIALAIWALLNRSETVQRASRSLASAASAA